MEFRDKNFFSSATNYFKFYSDRERFEHRLSNICIGGLG